MQRTIFEMAMVMIGGAMMSHAALAEETAPAWHNMAAGKPYVLAPAPNYTYCTDAGDRTQLTDGLRGEEADGQFWTQTSTVGWMHVGAGRIEITLDLGEVVPIRGVSFNTAAGAAGVEWPEAIHILISDDGQGYHPVGELITLDRQHLGKDRFKKGYHVDRLWTDALATHGRYVRLITIPTGPFVFVDEIEVYQGEDAWLSRPYSVDAIENTDQFIHAIQIRAGVQRRLHLDIKQAREAVSQAAFSAERQHDLLQELDAIEAQLADLPLMRQPETFTTVFPLNALHERIFAIQGRVDQASGAAPLSVWTTNRYDFLRPTDRPKERSKPTLHVAAMRGETRSQVINLRNATDQPIQAALRVEGLAGDEVAPIVQVYRVAWTDTQPLTATMVKNMPRWAGPDQAVPIASALLRMAAEQDGSYLLELPAGMTQQVWFDVAFPREMKAGEQDGQLVISSPVSEPMEVPLRLRVFDLDFPDRPTLHVGGFDYTNTSTLYGLTPENIQPLLALLQDHFVDTPWASSQVMPYGRFDQNGHLVDEPDTSSFDQWIARWPEARRYAVFAYVKESMGGLNRGTAAFDRAVGEWISFWVRHARSRGIEPEQLYLLLVDEPRRHEDDQLTADWARPIKSAQPRVVIWTDPVYFDPHEASPVLWQAADVISPLRTRLDPAAIQFYEALHAAGKRLEVYSCSGPMPRIDPYSYCRLQAWTAFAMSAEATHFWSFTGVGDGGNWNEYLNSTVTYTPFFLDATSATPAKHMRAIRESVQDYEYLVMLKRQIEQFEPKADSAAILAQANRLLEEACPRVLQAEGALVKPGGLNLSWESEIDRNLADSILVEIAMMIQTLRGM